MRREGRAGGSPIPGAGLVATVQAGDDERTQMARQAQSVTATSKRQRDADRSREDILAVARQEFAEHGFSGARVDEIANRTRTTKRMIYYYFSNKEQLYIEVLEEAYREIRTAEQQIAVDGLPPLAALRRLAELTFDHHESHPDFIRLVSIENTHRAKHMRKARRFFSVNHPAIELIDRVLARGVEEGVIRPGIDPIDVHVMISSYCFFRVANRHTFQAIFGRDLLAAEDRSRYREMLGDLITAYVQTGSPNDI
jgi:AcrR family transcriptional regulator